MKRTYGYLVFLVLIVAVGLSAGCSSDTSQPTPTYIHVDTFSFRLPPSGSKTFSDRSYQITQVWAYYNNKAVGVFDLPATFPVITTGASGQLELAPGVAVDGLNDFLSAYPFYTIDTSTLISQPGKVINRTPVTTYYSDVNDYSIATFGNGTTFAPASGYLSIVPGTTLSGSDSGTISLVTGDTLEDSCLGFTIPSGNAFVELDYKGNTSFYVGLSANESNLISSTPYYLSGIYPTSTWQKFYLNVADFTAQYPATTYNLYIKAYLPPGQSAGTIYLRNIQLLSF